ncbi:hypothetical protein BOX15_Mlig033778g1, partial [Macrostomum lignano]
PSRHDCRHVMTSASTTPPPPPPRSSSAADWKPRDLRLLTEMVLRPLRAAEDLQNQQQRRSEPSRPPRPPSQSPPRQSLPSQSPPPSPSSPSRPSAAIEIVNGAAACCDKSVQANCPTPLPPASEAAAAATTWLVPLDQRVPDRFLSAPSAAQGLPRLMLADPSAAAAAAALPSPLPASPPPHPRSQLQQLLSSSSSSGASLASAAGVTDWRGRSPLLIGGFVPGGFGGLAPQHRSLPERFLTSGGRPNGAARRQ